MPETRKLLIDVLVSELNVGFVDDLLADIPNLYKESEKHIENYHLLGEAEKEYVKPHLRRGLIEKKFRDRALEHGLEASSVSNCADSAKYTLVRAGTLELTHSKTNSANAIPALSTFREQRSDANQMLHQTDLFAVDKIAEPAATTYAILTHGPKPPYIEEDGEYEGVEVGYITIGFPSPDGKRWAEPPIDLSEIRERMITLAQAADHAEVAQAAEKGATPKLKKHASSSEAPNQDRELKK